MEYNYDPGIVLFEMLNPFFKKDTFWHFQTKILVDDTPPPIFKKKLLIRELEVVVLFFTLGWARLYRALG